MTLTDNEFTELIMSVKNQSYKIAFCYLHNEDNSMDAVCNAVEKAYRNIRKLKNKKFFCTWFIRIVINECNLLMKKNKRAILLIDNMCSIYNLDLQIETKLDLSSAINKLLPFDRVLIIMKYYMGYTLNEISEIVGIPLGSVKTKIYKNLGKLKTILREDV